MLTILGIRHHGFGSARRVLSRLKTLQPDMILVEGAPELDAITNWIGNPALVPPVAVLCYDTDTPQRASFYPFAEFSPEWQAIAYANARKIPVRMMDLPMATAWEMQAQQRAKSAENAQNTLQNTGTDGEIADTETATDIDQYHFPPPRDPLSHLGEIAGYENGEAWWEQQFEQQIGDTESDEDYFAAVMLTMQTLRDANIASSLDAENVHREAFMGNIIRKAQREMYDNIVVICGAWHAPALLDLDKTEKAHAKIVAALPKTKIKAAATWVPWTHSRLSMHSGYGAGIGSPGWYMHRWRQPEDAGEWWLTKVAQLLREQKMDISTAHVLEAFRLAQSLAALRGRSRAGLDELNEATQTVMLMGDAIALKLVQTELIVGQKLGKVPNELPKLPLQADFEQTAKKLKMAQTAEAKTLELDLRKPLDLSRSVFIFRLLILDIEWAYSTYARSKGTFKEVWTLVWKPEMLIALIERAIWGNTIETAAEQFLLQKADNTQDIGELAKHIAAAIPAELFGALERLLQKITDLATVSADLLALMSAVVPLAQVGRYGNVRNSDATAIRTLVDGLTTRICIGLPNAAYGMDDATSQLLFERIREVNDVIRLTDSTELSELWQQTLLALLHKDGVHAVVRGCVCRLLFDAKALDTEDCATQFAFALSRAQEATFSAAWLEGFLKGSGMILIYDDTLFTLLYDWVVQLPVEVFDELLPVLRRTFSKFEQGERQKLGEKAKNGIEIRNNPLHAAASNASEVAQFDKTLAEQALTALADLLFAA